MTRFQLLSPAAVLPVTCTLFAAVHGTEPEWDTQLSMQNGIDVFRQ